MSGASTVEFHIKAKEEFLGQTNCAPFLQAVSFRYRLVQLFLQLCKPGCREIAAQIDFFSFLFQDFLI